MIFSSKPQSAFGFDGVLLGKTRDSSVFMNGPAQRIDLRAENNSASRSRRAPGPGLNVQPGTPQSQPSGFWPWEACQPAGVIV